jgi:hypothetical protein
MPAVCVRRGACRKTLLCSGCKLISCVPVNSEGIINEALCATDCLSTAQSQCECAPVTCYTHKQCTSLATIGFDE